MFNKDQFIAMIGSCVACMFVLATTHSIAGAFVVGVVTTIVIRLLLDVQRARQNRP